MTTSVPPPRQPHKLLPITSHALTTYKLWHGYRNDFPKSLRYTIGEKIDSTFVSILESLFIAGYQNKNEKLPTIIFATKKTDLLKFFIRVSWELHALDDKKYIAISEKLEELGRMIGGWKRGLENKLESKTS